MVAPAHTCYVAPEHPKPRHQQQLRRWRSDVVDRRGPRAAAPGHRGLEDRTQKALIGGQQRRPNGLSGHGSLHRCTLSPTRFTTMCTSSTVAFILSALGRWHLVCLPAVFSLLRASYACYQPAAPHSSSPHVLERIPRRAPLSFRVCFVGSGAKGASADDWRMHARSCRVTPVALHYPGP